MKPSIILTAYHRLYSSYGAQGWWPITPALEIAPVYQPGKSLRNLSEQDRFEICLGALLTQNTQWSNVVKVLRGLKERDLLNHRKLLTLPKPQMERLFRSSGYFRQKTIRVKTFLTVIQKEAQGKFSVYFQGSLAEVRKKLLALHGVGPETADSMLLYSAGKTVFVVDSYTKRVAQRWGVLKGQETYNEIQQLFQNEIPSSLRLYAEYHALLVRLAKDHCRPRPVCKACPLSRLCPTSPFQDKNRKNIRV
ncbi:MAG: Endonuclease III [Elusimicrobia bacterium]|nr:Endonuclease III [Elusimicrobiota bacterium]